MNKELCDCGKVAIWCYMPGFSGGGNSFVCDDCVHRGCSCNHRYVDVDAYIPPLSNPDIPTTEDEPIKWIEEGKVWCRVDEKGREYPCCEYEYDEEGFDIFDDEEEVKFSFVENFKNSSLFKNKNSDENEC